MHVSRLTNILLTTVIARRTFTLTMHIALIFFTLGDETMYLPRCCGGFTILQESNIAKIAQSKLQENTRKLQGINLRAADMQDTAQSFSSLAKEVLRTEQDRRNSWPRLSSSLKSNWNYTFLFIWFVFGFEIYLVCLIHTVFFNSFAHNGCKKQRNFCIYNQEIWVAWMKLFSQSSSFLCSSFFLGD